MSEAYSHAKKWKTCKFEWALLLGCLFVPLVAGDYYVGRLRTAPFSTLLPKDAARAQGAPFDVRDKKEVVSDLRKAGVDAYPLVYPFLYIDQPGFPSGSELIFPLGGISRATMVDCNESGKFSMYRSDRYGFNNPDTEYDRPAKVTLIGDSFLEGACVDRSDTIADRLRILLGGGVLTFGKGNTGALLQLAIFKEYAAKLRPKQVVWFFYEGNDLGDLLNEYKAGVLEHYRAGKTVEQGLIGRQDEIDRVLKRYIADTEAAQTGAAVAAPTKWKDIPLLCSLRLCHFRTIVRNYFLMQRFVDEELVGILRQANEMTSSWGGTLYFVYLPDWIRYSHPNKALAQRSRIIENVRALGVPVVDVHEKFEASGDPLRYFPFRAHGHYNPAGYKLVAKAVAEALAR